MYIFGKSEISNSKDTYTPVFIAALFTIAKTWKQLKGSSTDDWIEKLCFMYIYTMEYYLAIKNNKLFPFAATWMALKNIMLSEISQRKTNFIQYHSYMDYKNNTNECIYKIETDL